MFIFRSLKKSKEKENYEEFCKVYLESQKKEGDSGKKSYLFNPKHFTKRSFQIVVLEQTATSPSIPYDSHPSNNTMKDISSPTNHGNSFFNSNTNKDLFDIIFSQPGMIVNDSPFKNRIHFLTQENLIIFTLVYPSYSQILKRIRSQSHSPSLSRSSSLGDYASLNNAVLNDLSAAAASNSQRRVAICASWSCPLDDTVHMRLFFRFIVYFLQFFSILAEKVAYVHQEKQCFDSESMNKIRHWFVESLRAFFTGQRLALPIWNTSILLNSHKWFKESKLLPSMMGVFLNRVVLHLLNKYHTKEKDFILAKLLTVVLSYHQGWIHSINSNVCKRLHRQYTCSPGICQQYESRHNPLCSQLGSAMSGWGGISISRTIVLGSSHTNQPPIQLLLYFLTYWIRSCPITMRQEDLVVDCSSHIGTSASGGSASSINLAGNGSMGNVSGNVVVGGAEGCKKTTRRKAASCNDPTDNLILQSGSQEDLHKAKLHPQTPHHGNYNTIERGSTNSGIQYQNFGNGHGSTRSSASQGSSPVKELSEQTSYHLKNMSKNMMISGGQVLDVERMAEEYFKHKSNNNNNSNSGNNTLGGGGSIAGVGASSSISNTFGRQLSSDQRSGSGNVLNNIYVRDIPMVYGGKLRSEEDILHRSIYHLCTGSIQDTIVTGLVLQGVLCNQGSGSSSSNNSSSSHNNSASNNYGVMVGANYSTTNSSSNHVTMNTSSSGHCLHNNKNSFNTSCMSFVGVTSVINCSKGYYNGVLDEPMLEEEMRHWLRHIFWLYGGAPVRRGGGAPRNGATSTIPIPINAGGDLDNGMLSQAMNMASTNITENGDGSSVYYCQAPLCERPQSATAIIMNMDKCSVSLFTVTTDTRIDPVIHEVGSPSHLVMTMLDQLQSLLSSPNSSSSSSSSASHNGSSKSNGSSSSHSGSASNNRVDDIYLQYIESQLKGIHRKSVSLAHTLRELKQGTDLAFDNFTVNPDYLAKLIGCHTDDLPLLYSTALSHSPDIYLPDCSLFFS